ncbi:MAG TPA: hypothetical protein PKD56_09125, partial [Chitinophagales bacterium]|nr:hypothetical protein [Chitinophagales bacterium]
MFKSKAIQILRTLTNKEFKRLEDFVASPLWKHPAQAVNLFNILRKLYPDFDEKKLARVRVFRQIFPREVFNEQKLRYVISDLTKLLEQFIAQLNYMSDATHLNHHLQRAYAERGLSKFFYQSIEAGKEAIEKNELRDVQYNFNKFILEEERYIYSSVNNRQVVENENIIQDLENLIRNLDLFYVAKKLRYSCEFANNQNVFVLNYPNPLFLDAILQYLAQIEPAQLPPAVLVYRQVWHMLTKQNAEADYHELLNILNLYDTQFQKTELYEIYTYACNYCIRQINKGQYHFMQHLFNIYKLLIDKEILISVGSLSERMYKNIVSLALKLGHFDFAQTFMHDYKKWL